MGQERATVACSEASVRKIVPQRSHAKLCSHSRISFGNVFSLYSLAVCILGINGIIQLASQMQNAVPIAHICCAASSPPPLWLMEKVNSPTKQKKPDSSTDHESSSDGFFLGWWGCHSCCSRLALAIAGNYANIFISVDVDRG